MRPFGPHTRRSLALLAVISLATACASTVDGTPGLVTHSATRATPSVTTARPTAPTTTPTRTSSAPPTTHTSSAPPTSAPPTWARFYGRQWTRLPTSRRVVALTFDAGGDDAGVASILSTLTHEHVAASFFLTGAWAQHYPAAARSVAGAGRVGDHSFTHPHFTALSTAQIRDEVLTSARAITIACGMNPAPFFRFPYGDADQRTIDAVNSLGYVPIAWTVDTLGWEGTSGGSTTSSVVQRVLAAAQPGEIVLMHVGANPDDRSTLDASALPQVIAGLRARGYSFVTLDALLGMTP
jgi:peptidoglycan/xylan/chitin deacetylase (PgdA/CDA1 family)